MLGASVYSKTLLVDKSLEIVGPGLAVNVCIRAIHACALTTAGHASVRLENAWLQVRVARGKTESSRAVGSVETQVESSLQLEGCIVEGGSCGLKKGGSLAVVVNCTVRECSTGLMGCERAGSTGPSRVTACSWPSESSTGITARQLHPED